jgi:hypothetical protein
MQVSSKRRGARASTEFEVYSGIVEGKAGCGLALFSRRMKGRNADNKSR